jgi:hypothetical protein
MKKSKKLFMLGYGTKFHLALLQTLILFYKRGKGIVILPVMVPHHTGCPFAF